MSFSGSVGVVVRRGILASPAFVVGPLLLLAAACGTSIKSPTPKAPESAALSNSSKHGDAGTQYSFVLFDVPGASKTIVVSLNDEGDAAGTYIDGNGDHGFIRKHGGAITTFDIEVDGGVGTIGYGINNFGEVVGWFNTVDDQHGFLRKPNGSIQTIDFEPFQGFDGTYAAALNNFGEIVGGYGPTYDVGFVLRNGRYTSQPNPPNSSDPPLTFPQGINDLGWTSGYYVDPSGVNHGYVLHGTSYTIVDFPGSSLTQVFSINDLGQAIVGADTGCNFIFDLAKKTFTPLPCVGIGSGVFGINNRGQFSGINFDSVDPDNLWHGFIATPVRSDE
jgi:probable HAF family extracellular repeat protein